MIKNHIEVYPEFQKLPIIELTVGNLKDWMLWLANEGRSNQTIDKALLAIKVPVREGVAREDLKHDPTKNVTQPTFTYQEKGVLNQHEVKSLVETFTDRDTLVAVLLGALCGMREGEVRGLRHEDIKDGEIHIKNNFQDIEGGDKNPKNNSFRSVPLPSGLEKDIGTGAGYIFPNKNAKDKPRCAGYFRNRFIRAMEEIGISKDEQKRRNLSFHSLRHTFITLGRLGGIPDPIIRALVGHKSASMTERYSHVGKVLNLVEAQKAYRKAIGLTMPLCPMTEDNKRTIFDSKPYEGMRANL
jgi:integrase